MVLLTGCGQQAALERDVAAALKDPDSAKFGEIYIRGEGAERVACGSVNAKNGFGAYGGDTPFMVRGDLLFIPVSGLCCKLTLVEERESTANLYRECEAERPEPIPIGD